MKQVPAFSRGRSSPLGKHDARVETVLPAVIAEELTTIARLHGKTSSEWVRDLIIERIRGEWAALRLRAGIRDENPEIPR